MRDDEQLEIRLIVSHQPVLENEIKSTPQPIACCLACIILTPWSALSDETDAVPHLECSECANYFAAYGNDTDW
jgi:hypothetical protein